MRCRGNGIVDMSLVVRGVPPSDSNTGKLLPVSIDLEPGESYPLRISPYGQNLDYTLPVEWVETFPDYSLLLRVAGSARADDPFFTSLRGTTNFSYQLRTPATVTGRENELVWLGGGLDFSSFREDVAPLLEHCRAGNTNPMDREMGPAVEIAATPMATLLDVNLDFLPESQRQSFRRILEGERWSSESSPRLPLLTYFAFHQAYWERCATTSDVPMSFYMTTPLPKVRTIGIQDEDYASFVVSASVYPQVSRETYDNEIRNDFSFDVVTQRFDEAMERQKDAWLSVFAHHGCSGEVYDAFREAVSNNLPYLEYRNGSREVIVDFGGTSFDIRLPQPINLEMAREIAAAEMASVNNSLFTRDYPGQILRSIAVGNFALADRIEDEFIAAIVNPFVGNSENPILKLLKPLMEFESAMKRQSNIIAAYAVGRMHILGSCGEPTTSYQQDTVYWTEYTNGLGQYVSSSAESRKTDYASVPSKFDSIVRTHNSITTSAFLSSQMATIISRLSCDSSIRVQLEDNLIAYFNGSAPAHIRPISND
ncbi:hypothetical protein ELY33_13265 [Vreelandella andesensis]|uniref:Uncharacterized protein n=2 Tax=Vreelandella andesensis TaxID=447567 RepID=A0A433KHK5_9GAMM|nr:hypothetical protein ELY33_13265 [Halomonas andesensis]